MDERGIRKAEVLDGQGGVAPVRLWQNVGGVTLFMALLLLLILTAKKGGDLAPRAPMLAYLRQAEAASARDMPPPRAIVAHNPQNAAEEPYCVTLCDVLDAMRVPWQGVMLDALAPCLQGDGIDQVFLCAQDLSLLTDDIPLLMAWVERGGRLALMMTPEMNDALAILARKIGCIDYSAGFVEYTSIRFMDGGLLPLWDAGSVYTCDGDLQDFTLAMRLEDDCRVLLEVGDDSRFPLLWTRDVGRGRILVNDNSLLSGKDSRGLAAAVVLALEDTTVYPIINAGMLFIDDFPAPQPAGVDKELMEQFGYDIQGFFRNHWWPDMKRLTWEYGMRFTGVLVETYNDDITPPFAPEADDKALARFYASELLQSGGELGLHGYNHMPLCLDGFQYADEDYLTWGSVEDMRLAVAELYRYGQKFLPGAEYRVYVPPSNYLSDQGREALLRAAPSVRTISGLYLSEAGVNALVQEFCEEADGTVSVPRVTSGFVVSEYDTFVMAQELLLRGVYSHFIHPDDVLDLERSMGYGWRDMYAFYAKSVADVCRRYPALRWSTASEGASAVQRYARAALSRQETTQGLSLTIVPFYDEAWLALRTDKRIASTEGCELYDMGEGLYWLRATQGEASVLWEDGL